MRGGSAWGWRRLSPAIAAAIAIALGVVISVGNWRPFDGDSPRIDAEDDAQVALGQLLYRRHCARCHGVDLEGQPNWRERKADGRLPAPPHDSDGHTWHHPDKVLLAITRDGIGAYAPPGYRSDMPAFEGVVSDFEIAAIIAYIKSRWPTEIRVRQEAANR